MCDICQTKNEVNYNSYNLCLNYGFYSCNKCKNIKKKKTNLQKYGVENFNNTEKRKNTHNLKYGTYYTNRDKAKMTCLEKYGVENVSMIDEVKKIKSETAFSNWGVLSDFYLPKFNLICEIKSDYYYQKYLSLNISKKKESENLGYNFIFVKDKKYNELISTINI